MTCPSAAYLAIPLGSPVSAADRASEGTGDEFSSATAPNCAGDGRELADFDLPAVLDDLNLFDVGAALAELEAVRGPYTCAARRAGVLLAADFSDEVTAVLCARRTALESQVQELPLGAASPAGGGRQAEREVEALNDLAVRVNAWRVDDMVRRFAPPMSPEDLEDVRAAAAEGLARAVMTFDAARGRFGQWAFKPMRGAVLNAVRALQFPTMSWKEFLNRPAVLAAREALTGAGQQEPAFADVAAKCVADVTPGQVERVLRPAQVQSLETFVGEGGRGAEDVLVDEEMSVEDEVADALHRSSVFDPWLAELDARAHFVVVRRFGLDGEPEQCLASIGRQLKLSREVVRQIEGKALNRLFIRTHGARAARRTSR
ncbi:sigma factor-like helix-turn-helix DNA-binding protein [Geodermatophilus sabuli]|uniref:RNA polymerase sigma factor, sigma-70 family n=1 Tax=Geodermatophilus sabuli TaxID=1564158 RepID=A0A285EE91_9ACTN|nr:sigma factor-like helix-turn-helix DNA-binding protein [Geodermatophilus sabuli]MBB3084214.1 RNA polymerase sigma factor (sigma-70 family) [Geodermatophilus sabuli]SNX96514.1 RNA polymerase sigma factor, sigma-70 family [Geodermatophilus sabuli]